MTFMIEAPVAVLDAVRWTLMIVSLPLTAYILRSFWKAQTMQVRCIFVSYEIFMLAGFLDRIHALGLGYFTYSLPLYIVGVGVGLFAVWGSLVNWWLRRRDGKVPA